MKKLNAIGAAHLLLPLLIIVGAGIIGSFVAVKSVSHADIASSASVIPYNGRDDGCGSNATHYNGSTHVGRTHNGPHHGVCKCNTGKTVSYKAVSGNNPNPKCSSSSTTSSGGTSKGGIVAYNGNDDGCGSNATHYHGSTHVGRTGHGKDSICKCKNGKTVSYKAVSGNSANLKCKKVKTSAPVQPAPKTNAVKKTAPFRLRSYDCWNYFAPNPVTDGYSPQCSDFSTRSDRQYSYTYTNQNDYCQKTGTTYKSLPVCVSN